MREPTDGIDADAGVEKPITATSEITEEEWNRNIRINLTDVF